jgi:hypothetical protein
MSTVSGAGCQPEGGMPAAELQAQAQVAVQARARPLGQSVTLIVNRPGAQFVSLRGDASDALGNRIDQTIIRAYGLAP